MQGVQGLHACGRAHVDLKPENLFIRDWQDLSKLYCSVHDLGGSLHQFAGIIKALLPPNRLCSRWTAKTVHMTSPHDHDVTASVLLMSPRPGQLQHCIRLVSTCCLFYFCNPPMYLLYTPIHFESGPERFANSLSCCSAAAVASMLCQCWVFHCRRSRCYMLDSLCIP